MTEKQPEALRHSEWLESLHTTKASKAAAELRRLHALNAELLKACKLFIAYELTADSNDGTAMIMTYNAASDAISKVITKAEATK